MVAVSNKFDLLTPVTCAATIWNYPAEFGKNNDVVLGRPCLKNDDTVLGRPGVQDAEAGPLGQSGCGAKKPPSPPSVEDFPDYDAGTEDPERVRVSVPDSEVSEPLDHSSASDPDSRPSGPALATPRLSDVVPRQLRRGVRLERALAGFGKHWSGDISGGLGVEQRCNLFELSEGVEGIRDFLSHDWATHGWMKFITLCLIYNGRAALLVSYSVALVLGCLTTDALPLLPRPVFFVKPVGGEVVHSHISCYGVAVAPIAYVLTLLFWQRVRTLFRGKPTWVFMDKLCVHQTDASMKKTGIMSLAGFLRISERLVVLWSPRYLTRLWCVYELATWIHLNKPTSGVIFMPVALSLLIMAWFVGMWIFYILLSVATLVSQGFEELFTLLAVLAAVSNAIIPGVLARHLSQDLHHMTEQLSTFSARSAECFCCTHDHVRPDTGETLSCDRRLVFGMLQHWFQRGSRGSARSSILSSLQGGADFLDVFDAFVRDRLGSEVLRKAGGSRLRYSVALAVSVPGVGYCADRLPAIYAASWAGRVRTALQYAVVCWLLLPGSAKLLLALAVQQRRLCCRLCCGDSRWWHAVLTATLVLSWLALIVPIIVVNDRVVAIQSPVPQLAFSFFMVVTVALMFLRRRQCCGCAARKNSLPTAGVPSKF